ncbi:hypothetical protein [Georgenia sp. SUBG003]|uniref:hypothetical protein n=1 Tax=Georgenia sp. SUBG003 TaxID=1497974 RepID=UPI003AB390B2
MHHLYTDLAGRHLWTFRCSQALVRFFALHRIREDFVVGDVDSLDSSIVAMAADVWEKKYSDVEIQWENGYVPLTALRSASSFYEWRDQAMQAGSEDSERLTSIYREMVSGLHVYRIPSVIVNRKIPPQAVARISNG